MRISKILKQTKILFLIGLIDLLLTLILFNLFGFDAGIEENSIFRWVLVKSPFIFALLKVATLLLCLSIIEFVRQKSAITDKVAKTYLKIGIGAYLFLYAALVIKVNLF